MIQFSHLNQTKKYIMKNTTETQIKNALRILAKGRLPNADLDDIECEVGRLDRCIEWFYKEQDHDMHFLEFSSHFIQQNFKELLFGTLFSGNYTEDVLDEPTPDISNYYKYKALKANGGHSQYVNGYSAEHCDFEKLYAAHNSAYSIENLYN